MPTKQPSRRSFLKTSAAAGGAVVASGSLGALRAASPVHQGGGKHLEKVDDEGNLRYVYTIIRTQVNNIHFQKSAKAALLLFCN